MNIKSKINPDLTRITIGSTFAGLGGACVGFSNNKIIYYFAILLLFVGAVMIIISFIDYEKHNKIINTWDHDKLKKALERAPNDSHIKILQTWWPDDESLCPYIEELLTTGNKCFSFEIFLMWSDNFEDANSLIACRERLRSESAEEASDAIHQTIKRLNKMKERIDLNWKQKYKGRTFQLSIKQYNTLPFGPIYQIGDDLLFFGLFHNYDSSEIGPMIEVHRHNNPLWVKIEKNLQDLGEGSIGIVKVVQ